MNTFKNHSTPHLLSLVLILAASFFTFFAVKTSDIAYSRNLQALVVGVQEPINPPNLWYLDISLPDGGCRRNIMNDDGSYTGMYYSGTWGGSGTGCVLIANRPPVQTQTPMSSVPSRGLTDTTFNAESPLSYLGSMTGMLMLQVKLQTAGVLDGTEQPGAFDIKTFQAIKSFQTKNKLSPTGYLDAQTLALLNAVKLPAQKRFTGTAAQTTATPQMVTPQPAQPARSTTTPTRTTR